MEDVKPAPHRAAQLAQSWWAVALIGLLVATVLYQRWQATHPKLPPFLQSGEQLPSLKLKPLNNEDIDIAWTGQPTLVYVFKPDCRWCTKNLPAARTLIDHASGYRIVGLSLASGGLRDYLHTNRITFPVYLSSGARASKALKIFGTPTTIVVSGSGKVESTFGFRFPAPVISSEP